MTKSYGQRRWPLGLAWKRLVILLLSLFLTVQALDDDSRQRKWWNNLRRRLQQALRQRRRDDEPGPIVVDDFLTDDEASSLLQRYEPLLRESLHFGQGSAKRTQYRTSQSVRLPPMGDELVFEIEQRAADLAGFPHSHVEDFQLACYGVDQLYGLHRDDHDDPVKRANRAATVLIYLQAPEDGGATLFTRRPLEDEHDLDTKRKLNTEKGALKLFRHYCARPRKKFVVVEPKVGRAATWENWHGENRTEFCRRSTHGACPVTEGRKCVIQQWIVRTTPLPLRDPRLAGIFTAGADYSFHEARNSTTVANQAPKCLLDASTNRGEDVPKLCLESNAEFHVLDASEGPYNGVGGLRLIGGALSGSIPSSFLIKDGLTISFWVRSIQEGTTLLSLGNIMSVVLHSSESQDSLQTLELLRPDDSSEVNDESRLTFYNPSPTEKWLWISLTVDGAAAHLNVFSREGEQLGSASLLCGDFADKTSPVNSPVALKMFVPPVTQTDRTTFVPVDKQESAAFVVSSDASAAVVADVSFVLIHKAVLDLHEARVLRKEVGRYNIAL